MSVSCTPNGVKDMQGGQHDGVLASMLLQSAPANTHTRLVTTCDTYFSGSDASALKAAIALLASLPDPGDGTDLYRALPYNRTHLARKQSPRAGNPGK